LRYKIIAQHYQIQHLFRNNTNTMHQTLVALRCISIFATRIFMKKHFPFTFLFFTATFFGCHNSDDSDNVKSSDTTTIDMNKDVVSAENVFVFVPSPIETAGLLKDAGAKYNKDFLNPPQNVSKYSNTASQALNLGVYGTDLAFAGIFEQHSETMIYMNCTGKLADLLHISSAFNSDRSNRLENNINNRDSILSIITDSYWDCDALLHENNQGQASALMISGGWIEGLYLACKVAEATNSNDIRVRIVEQRSSLDKLVGLLDKQKNADIQPIDDQLKNLKKLFDALPKQQVTESTVTTDAKTGVTTIGSDNSPPPISLNDLEFKNILTEITKIRNGITVNP